MNKLANTFMSIICIAMAACGNDEPSIPSNAIPLNMMNEPNGKTLLGSSDVYIDNANNFTSANCGIVDLGNKSNFGVNPDLTQISHQVAVTPGNFYQVMLVGDMTEVAGQRAFRLGSTYYNAYVESWITDKEGNISGAKVLYMECEPKTDKLPGWNSDIVLELNDGTAEYTFAEGTVIDPYYSSWTQFPDAFKVNITNNKIDFINSSWSNTESVVDIKVRYKSLYTQVKFIVRY